MESEVIDLLESCLKQGTLTLAELTSAVHNNQSISSFAKKLTGHVSSQGADAGDKVKNIKIQLKNNKFRFSLKLPTPIWDLPVEGHGEMYLDRETNQLVIKVKEVKTGKYFPVTTAFFKALSGVGDGRLTVSQPYLRLRLSD